MLKLYEFNPPSSWRGCLVCITTSKEKAFEIFSRDPMIFDSHETLDSITEHELVDGVSIVNYGDV